MKRPENPLARRFNLEQKPGSCSYFPVRAHRCNRSGDSLWTGAGHPFEMAGGTGIWHLAWRIGGDLRRRIRQPKGGQ